MKKILITGANGFVGSALASHLLKKGFAVTCASRSVFLPPQGAKSCIIGDISTTTNWTEALSGVEVVIHTVARTHVMHDTAVNPLEEYRKINVAGTLNIAKQAFAAGVKRFVFLSSIKVNGEFTSLGKPFRTDDIPAPLDPYGISKYEAEMGLKNIAKQTGMEVVIIRPTLVYGPEVKANFLSMMKWLYRGIPLPFGAIHNKRSLVALDNLISLIITCLDHPNAANQTFLVSDDEDLSTTNLLKRVAHSLGKNVRLLPIPESLLRAGLNLFGKKDLARRLLGSLQVDITKTKELLNWSPVISVDEALKKTAQHFLSTHA